MILCTVANIIEVTKWHSLKLNFTLRENNKISGIVNLHYQFTMVRITRGIGNSHPIPGHMMIVSSEFPGKVNWERSALKVGVTNHWLSGGRRKQSLCAPSPHPVHVFTQRCLTHIDGPEPAATVT